MQVPGASPFAGIGIASTTLMNEIAQLERTTQDAKSPLVHFDDVKFENTFVRELPADPVLDNVPRQVRHAAYTLVQPTPVRDPRLLAWSDDVGGLLGIVRPESVTGLAAQVLGGNKVLPGMKPYAARYGGHQFGHWAGQLGDGRAISLEIGRTEVATRALLCRSRVRLRTLLREVEP